MAQSSVFVFVDVSGSTPKNVIIRDDAKKIVYDLCLGGYNKPTYMASWEWIGTPDSFIQGIINGTHKASLVDPAKDGYLLIMPFGEKNTYRNYQIGKLNQLPGDLDDFFNKHYPKVFKDLFTYQNIAYAAGASIAKGRSIDSYYMIVVSDNLTDPNTDSKAPQYTPEEEEWIAAWGTSDARNIKLGTLKYKGNESNFQVVVSRVDIKNINISTTNPQPQNVARKELKLIRPAGTRNKPEKLTGNTISALWSCLGCDSLTSFAVRLAYEGKKKGIKSQSKTVNENRAQFRVEEPGTYKLTISSKGFGIQTAHVEIEDVDMAASPDGGGSAFPLLLFVILLLAGGYFLWQRNRQHAQSVGEKKKVEKDRQEDYWTKRNEPGDNPFRKGNDDSGSSTGDYW